MARAAFYYYVPESWCIFCYSATEETRIVGNPVQDLSERTVGVPCHGACWRRKFAGSWLRFAVVLLAVSAALTGFELFLIRFGRPTRLHAISNGLMTLNLAIGLVAATVAGAAHRGRLRKKIQDYIQLRTYPYD
jgi:uncharacterized membrane protein